MYRGWLKGLVNFVAALAHHFRLNLPAPFTQPGVHLLAEPCTRIIPRGQLRNSLKDA